MQMFTKKTFNFVNTTNDAVRRLGPVKKLSAVTWRDSKNLLIAKLLTNVNFVISHKKVFLVKLSIS